MAFYKDIKNTFTVSGTRRSEALKKAALDNPARLFIVQRCWSGNGYLLPDIYLSVTGFATPLLTFYRLLAYLNVSNGIANPVRRVWRPGSI